MMKKTGLACTNQCKLQIPSKYWLAKKTASWTVKTHLNINVPREQALEIIGREGMLLVLCSYIDNMPYVVAEAAVGHTSVLTVFNSHAPVLTILTVMPSPRRF